MTSLQLGPGSLICSQKAKRSGKRDGSAAIAHTKLAIDISGMHFDRSRRDYQLSRNLLVREVFVEQVQDLHFAVGQGFQALLSQQRLSRYWWHGTGVHGCQDML